MILGKNFHCFDFFLFEQNKPKKMFYNILDTKEPFAGCKNIDFRYSPNWIFPKRLVHNFGQKF